MFWQQILQYKGNVEDDMCMSFLVPGVGPGRKDVELLPGGANVPVTNDNRNKFVDLYASYVMQKSVAPQLQALRWGFHVCLSEASMELFNGEELEVSGLGWSLYMATHPVFPQRSRGWERIVLSRRW